MPHADAIGRRAQLSASMRPADLLSLAQLVALTGGMMLLAVAALLFLRRISGGIAEPLTMEVRLLAGVALTATASVLRLPWLGPSPNAMLRATGLVLPLPALLLFALALSFPLAPIGSVVVLWLGVIAHESLWTVYLWRGRRFQPSAAPRPAVETDPPRQARESAATAQAPASNVTQQLVRKREGDADTITGVLRTEVSAGERTCSLHVAFCPPLATSPQLQCEQIEGPAANITLGEVQSYGARIDVRLLRTTSQPATLAVEFYARS
jgi:hypothetical protein